MFTLDGMRKLHGWTHSCVGVLLDHLSSVPGDAYARAVPGFGFPTLREQMIHIFNCEGFWVHTLRGLPYVDRPVDECPAVADARRMQAEVSAWTMEYLSGLTEEQLNRNTELHFPEGDVAVRTPALVLHHMLTHAFHHKGQAAAMCRILGHPIKDTDLNQFE